MLLFSLFFWVSLWFFSYAEWEKVVIDPVTKKIIIQSWDQNLDLEALKTMSQSGSWEAASGEIKSAEINEEQKRN